MQRKSKMTGCHGWMCGPRKAREKILLEMRSLVLFEPTVDGCSAPEVECAVSTRQIADRERFLLERSWEAKYMKYKGENNTKEEILKIQNEDQKRSIGSEEYLKASMLISNNFVKDLLRDLSDDPLPVLAGRETSRCEPPEKLANLFERQEGEGQEEGQLMGNIVDIFQQKSSANMSMAQLKHSFQGSLDTPLAARIQNNTLEKRLSAHPDFSMETRSGGTDVKLQVNLAEGHLVKPEVVRYEDYKEIIENVIDFCQANLPFRVSRVGKGGSLGHDTGCRSRVDVDIVLYSHDLPKIGHSRWLPSIIAALSTLLQDAPRVLNKDTKFPELCHVSSTRYSVQFSVGELDVDIIPCYDWQNEYDTTPLFRTIREQRSTDIIWFFPAVCEKESDFVRKQPIKIKEMVRMVKHWRNGILWKDQFHRPSSLLLSLMVIGTHEQLVKSGVSNLLITPQMLLKKLTEVIQRKHELRYEWSTYYNESVKSMFPMKTSPVVRNPANASDNVAETGLQNWTQFPGEFTRWTNFIGVVHSSDADKKYIKQEQLKRIASRLVSDP